MRQRGVLEARLVASNRGAEVGVAAVGDVDGHGVHAVQGVVARGRVGVGHERDQGGAAHVRRDLAAMGVEHGGHDVDGHGVHAVQGVVARGRVGVGHERDQGGAAHVRRDLAAMGVEHGGHDVDGLRELMGVLARSGVARKVHDERQVRELVVQVHVVLAHVVALAQEVAVIGGDHDHGVLEHAALGECTMNGRCASSLYRCM